MAWEATYLLSPVVLLLLASGSWAQDPEILQTVEGKTVSMTCWYDPSYSYSEKIWCKKVSDTICQAPVHCDSTGAEKLRFSIQQSPWFSFFTVTMTELKIQDSGTYYCGLIGNSGNNIILRTLRLVVSEGSSDVFTPDIIPTTRLPELPTLIITKHSPSHTTSTRSLHKPTAVVSSPDPGVTIINGTDAARSSISSVLVPLVCGLLSKTLVFTVLFIVTQRSFG
ncbi:triggering receptor expressed on myeloid cells 1-like isoform X1 [Apodemus sylvaticus]|uniref:triggering receptor expressed on myeloid cells 1-like isoform X1 n=1 Tax=Apodemus sylvaticus TaxID=10129 RepID=UPI0022435C48|nr:triggering receptor expressed on myeloid cells 1-like isoform X1 [Apodemus sylvaticus]